MFPNARSLSSLLFLTILAAGAAAQPKTIGDPYLLDVDPVGCDA